MRLDELKDKFEEIKNKCNNEKSVSIHLFAIKYAKVITEIKNDLNISNTDIARAININDSYHSEIAKGLTLAKYVVDKDKIKALL